MQTFVIEINRDVVPLVDVLQVLDAIGSILEPNPVHKPSTDTLAMQMGEGRLIGVHHQRLGVRVVENA
jgi:hypothetical protein